MIISYLLRRGPRDALALAIICAGIWGSMVWLQFAADFARARWAS